MSNARRIQQLPDCPFKKGKEVRFFFEGKPVTGFRREPVAVALLAHGVKVFGRSMKYHRPRGPVCFRGHCSSCLMRVDGIPNTRTCQIRCSSGIRVKRQLGWPSSGLDLMRISDWVFGRRMDHHSIFTASGTINRAAMGFIRKMAGYGSFPTADPISSVPVQSFDAPVVVIGAGAAGLSAACALAENGHPAVILESDNHRGGRLLDGACQVPTDDGEIKSGWETRLEFKSRLEDVTGVEIHHGTPAIAVYPKTQGPQVIASNDRETWSINTRRLVIATGAYSQVPLFENNDLPGIITPRALDRLVFGWGVIPAEPVLIVGDGDETINLALQLKRQGIKLAGLVTSASQSEPLEQLKKLGIAVYSDRKVFRANGGQWLDRVELAPHDSQVPELVLDCKLLIIETPESPAYELAHHAGCRVEFDSSTGYVIKTDPQGCSSNSKVFAAGHCAGATNVKQAIHQGMLAGLACSFSLKEDPQLAERIESLTQNAQS